MIECLKTFLATYFNATGCEFWAVIGICLLYILRAIYVECELYLQKRMPFFPRHIMYHGQTYTRHDGATHNFYGFYLAAFGVAILLMSFLEHLVEGSVGTLARIEILAVAIGFFGNTIGKFTAIIPLVCYQICHDLIHKGYSAVERISAQGRKDPSSVPIFIRIATIATIVGGYLGIMAGIIIAYYLYFIDAQISGWALLIILSIPVIIFTLDIYFRFSKYAGANKFAWKVADNTKHKVLIKYPKDGEQLSYIVESVDPNKEWTRIEVKKEE